MNITVIQSVWRRLRRPSPETISTLRALERPRASQNFRVSCDGGRTFNEYHEPRVPKLAGRFISNHELEKFALQNAALQYVLESHENSHSHLAPTALDFVNKALRRSGAASKSVA